MQLSLVAYYGNKPASLRRLVTDLQSQLQLRLGRFFRPYQMDQVHATVIGLECITDGLKCYSRWYRENREALRPVDFTGFLSHLMKRPPKLKIRMGGYRSGQDYGFLSRGDHPYSRSFSFQGTTAVVVGWPAGRMAGKLVYTDSFYQLRRSFEAYHLCHKWHKDGYRDNDCYLVLGKIKPDALPEEELQQISRDLQQMLAQREILFPLDGQMLTIVAYENAELPLETTRVLSLEEIGSCPAKLSTYLEHA
ncbi:hypothetical protein [Flavilitoribacter nigricans]|uniref:Uncharacterized protein n=1 Tax=Flavilitoribacter nigricans (strain ATCC 23147 / DSM 23189 / NBRC 102662 / NCIMB 1420 / SS-2) TaxID=1122177 RepID=A0A2D0NK33_FLAN2|nr:hypothetical protein [Flavilitoribacter nigricans]PHN08103.1 hypothetical protein CRP01_01925 [Flavilitoribacter nigricans DSM 23189 = NBRC 102662]